MSKDTPTNEMFEAFQKMINPMAFPMQNLLMGGMKLEEVERKISELRTVHHWLSTNLGMLDLSIKTLEYQAALLQPVSKDSPAAPADLAASAAASAAAGAAQNPFLNPSLWPWPYGQAGAPAHAPEESASAAAAEAAKAKPAGTAGFGGRSSGSSASSSSSSSSSTGSSRKPR